MLTDAFWFQLVTAALVDSALLQTAPDVKSASHHLSLLTVMHQHSEEYLLWCRRMKYASLVILQTSAGVFLVEVW